MLQTAAPLHVRTFPTTSLLCRAEEVVRAEAEAEAGAGPEAVTPSDFQTNDDVGAAPVWVLPLPAPLQPAPLLPGQLLPVRPPAPSVPLSDPAQRLVRAAQKALGGAGKRNQKKLARR